MASDFMKDPNVIFFARAPRGNIIKVLFDVLCNPLPKGILHLTEEGISARQSDKDNAALFDIVFYREYFKEYKCESSKIITFNLKNAQKLLKNVKKKNIICIFISKLRKGNLGFLVSPFEATFEPNSKTNFGTNSISRFETNSKSGSEINYIVYQELSPENVELIDLPEDHCKYPVVIEASEFQKIKKFNNLGKVINIKMQNDNYLSFACESENICSSEISFGRIKKEELDLKKNNKSIQKEKIKIKTQNNRNDTYIVEEVDHEIETPKVKKEDKFSKNKTKFSNNKIEKIYQNKKLENNTSEDDEGEVYNYKPDKENESISLPKTLIKEKVQIKREVSSKEINEKSKGGTVQSQNISNSVESKEASSSQSLRNKIIQKQDKNEKKIKDNKRSNLVIKNITKESQNKHKEKIHDKTKDSFLEENSDNSQNDSIEDNNEISDEEKNSDEINNNSSDNSDNSDKEVALNTKDFDSEEYLDDTQDTELENEEEKYGIYSSTFSASILSLLVKLPGLCSQMQFYAPRVPHYPLKIKLNAVQSNYMLGVVQIFIKDMEQINYEESLKHESTDFSDIKVGKGKKRANKTK